MKNTAEQNLKRAARAAHTTPEKFAKAIRGLLCTPRCRDTRPRKRVFTAEVMDALVYS